MVKGGGPRIDVDGGPSKEEVAESLLFCEVVGGFVEDSVGCCSEERETGGGGGEEDCCDLLTSVEAEGVLVERD